MITAKTASGEWPNACVVATQVVNDPEVVGKFFQCFVTMPVWMMSVDDTYAQLICSSSLS